MIRRPRTLPRATLALFFTALNSCDDPCADTATCAAPANPNDASADGGSNGDPDADQRSVHPRSTSRERRGCLTDSHGVFVDATGGDDKLTDAVALAGGFDCSSWSYTSVKRKLGRSVLL